MGIVSTSCGTALTLPQLNVEGNEGADALANQGRQLHRNNLLPLSQRPRVTEWEALGLEPMPDGKETALGSEVYSGGGGGHRQRHQ